MKERVPIFARQGWYPADEAGCRRAVDGYLASFPGTPQGRLAGIVPHAGWVYSGRLAAWVFAALRAGGAAPRVVFVFGGHLLPRDTGAVMIHGAFGTPLGAVPVHQELAAEAVQRFGLEVETPEHFEPDNTLELQMPLVRSLWPEARVVAMGVAPNAQAEEIGEWAAAAAAERDLAAVAIGSTDLTHYGRNYGFTPRGSGPEALRWSKEQNDWPLLEALLDTDGRAAVAHALTHHSACCPGAAAAAVAFARAGGATAGRLIAHTTSSEEAGEARPGSWVGYGAIVY